jgi:hypothetical protein
MKRRISITFMLVLFSICSFAQDVDSLLAVIHKKDQGIRLEYERVLTSTPIDNYALMDATIKMDSIDAECQAVVFGIIENGIPMGLTEESYKTVWLVVQHSDTKNQKKYLPEFINLSKKGLFSLADCATMEDRILMNSNKRQKYGTQCYLVDGVLYLWPVKDDQKLEEFRNSVGLSSMEDMHEAYKKTGMNFIWDKAKKVRDFKGKNNTN